MKKLSKNGPVTRFWAQHADFCKNVQASIRILSRVRSAFIAWLLNLVCSYCTSSYFKQTKSKLRNYTIPMWSKLRVNYKGKIRAN